MLEEKMEQLTSQSTQEIMLVSPIRLIGTSNDMDIIVNAGQGRNMNGHSSALEEENINEDPLRGVASCQHNITP